MDFHLAIESIDRAVLILVGIALELDGRMTDVIPFMQHFVHGLQDERAFALQHIVDDGVTG